MKEIIQAVDDGDNILLTGGAGVGKTYHSNMIIDHMLSKKRKFAVCALTGLASQHLHFGMTIHRFLGIGNKTSMESFDDLMREPMFVANLDSLMDVTAILIDEVSMMRTDLLGLIDLVLKELRARKNLRDGLSVNRSHHRPFGDYQVIYVGDFCQLPPVVKKDESVPYKWIFQHPLFIEAEFRVYNLLEVKRTDDLKLATLYNKVRVGYLDKESEEIIASRNNAKSSVDATTLMSRIESVKTYNEKRIRDESGEEIILSGIVSIREEIKDNGDDKEIRNLYRVAISESGLVKDIYTKIGCKLMLLANNTDMDYSNGSQGKLLDIKRFSDDNNTFTNEEGKLIDLDFRYFGECLIVLLDNGRKVVVPRKPYHVYGHGFDEKGKRLIDASFYQYPVILGYGISIHKSQGMSLANMVLDCKQIFAEGQFYVGLSRGRSLDGISLLNFNKAYLRADPLAVNFYLQLASYKQGQIYGKN